ncbi:MAG TPA: hypothetical protein VN428_14035 [Bryobacteraceae bacterium]|nr:hypothetical protein [Bryobacteraceae bacterium]
MARTVRIAGGGPAGCAAALAAVREGAAAVLYEKSRAARHKVCGEFLSAEAGSILDSLDVSIAPLRPTHITRLEFHAGSFGRMGRLPEAASGVSRYALDAFLLARVPNVVRSAAPDECDVIATGRDPEAAGERLFGFKAHFTGPRSDTIGLYFFNRAYVGVNSVEGGMTNVCGLAPEATLRQHGFDFDALVNSYAPLTARLRPMSRAWKWIATGPVAFGRRFQGLRCGDALGFIDPFTGAGMLHALLTGRLAGIAAARGTPIDAYLNECRRALARPFATAAFIRSVFASRLDALTLVAPIGLIYRLTRAKQSV